LLCPTDRGRLLRSGAVEYYLPIFGQR
jgi:hypothetical protein